jgi:hypothetical protein
LLLVLQSPRILHSASGIAVSCEKMPDTKSENILDEKYKNVSENGGLLEYVITFYFTGHAVVHKQGSE